MDGFKQGNYIIRFCFGRSTFAVVCRDRGGRVEMGTRSLWCSGKYCCKSDKSGVVEMLIKGQMISEGNVLGGSSEISWKMVMREWRTGKGIKDDCWISQSGGVVMQLRGLCKICEVRERLPMRRMKWGLLSGFPWCPAKEVSWRGGCEMGT